MTPRSNRPQAGRVAKQRGDEHEAWVERQHDEAQNLGILRCVVHNEPHGKYIEGEWRLVRPGVADYTGILYEGPGRALAVEAKSTVGDRFQKSKITPEQRQYLDDAVAAGARAFLVLGFRSGGTWRRYAVLWAQVPWEVLKTAESVAESSVTAWRVTDDERCYLARYCEARGPRGGVVADDRVVVGGRKRVFSR